MRFCQATKGIFSATFKDRGLILCCYDFSDHEHLFYEYFVNQSVSQATKEKNVKIHKHKKITNPRRFL